MAYLNGDRQNRSGSDRRNCAAVELELLRRMSDKPIEVVSVAEVLAYFDRDRHLDMSGAEKYLSLSRRFPTARSRDSD